MPGPRETTLMMFDDDRYFVDGVLRFLQSRYRQVCVRGSLSQVKKVDLLLTGTDAVSLCASRQFAHLMSADSQLLVVHESHLSPGCVLPTVLQRFPAQSLCRGQSLPALARVLARLIPEPDRPIVVIDPRSVKEEMLTPREKMLIAHLRVHLTPHQIAARMHLHPKTISTYKRSVMLKLGMQKNLELYHWLFYSSVSEGERL